MKLSHLLAETPHIHPHLEHLALLDIWLALARKIWNDIQPDLEEENKAIYKNQALHICNDSLFNDHGKCMVEDGMQIFELIKNEKLEIYISAYDGDYEELFIADTPGRNLLTFKRDGASQDHIIAVYQGKSYAMHAADLVNIVQQFQDTEVGKYQRMSSATRIHKKRRYTSWDEPYVSDEDSYEYAYDTCSLRGALCFKALYHE